MWLNLVSKQNKDALKASESLEESYYSDNVWTDAEKAELEQIWADLEYQNSQELFGKRIVLFNK